MPFQPEFMQRIEEFRAERERVRTLEGWLAFQKKWFDTSGWPVKSSEQLAAESLGKRGPFVLRGRTWGYTTLTYDLTPEARYEYTWTWHTVGDPIKFPHLKDRPTLPPGEGWEQECPYCEISTRDLGEEECPICRRQLVYVSYAD